jgi:hypothetical protein
LSEHSNSAGRSRDGLKESLLNEGAVDSYVNHTDLGAIGRDLSQNLLGNLRLNATKGNEHDIRCLMTMVLEGLVYGTELIVEKLEKLNNLSSGIKTSVELASLSGELTVQVGNTVLTQSINDTESLASNSDTVVDVKSRQKGSQESGKDGHVLGLVGRGASNKTKANVFRKAKSSVVVGNQALAVRVVESGDMSNERTGDTVEERKLVESSAQLLETARRCNQRLRDMTLGDIKVGRENVTKSESTSANSGLEGKNLCGISVDVLLVLGGPFLECDIEVEGLGRV